MSGPLSLFPRHLMLLLTVAAVLPAVDHSALGGKHFYPSDRHPVGYRGDGNGWFPGATPVSSFHDVTVKRVELGDQGWGKPTWRYDVASKQSKNIVWRVPTPSWVNSHPIVVGDKIFSYGEPDLLFCHDAHTGDLLWQQVVNPWQAAGIDKKKAAQCREIAEVLRTLDTVIHMFFMSGTCGRVVDSTEYDRQATIFIEQDLPVILKHLRTLDRSTDYAKGAQAMAEVMRSRFGTQMDKKTASRTKPQLVERRHGDQLYVMVRNRLESLAGGRNVVPVDMPWGHMMGWNMSVPVSDGEHVFVQMGQGQIACFDLDGKQRWATQRYPYLKARKGSSLETYHKISPLLVGDVLVTNLWDRNKLIGLNKKTGEQVWEAPVSTARPSVGKGYCVADHKVLWVEDQPVIITNSCLLIRPSDGKVVGEYDSESYGGGSPIAGLGTFFISSASGDGFNGPFYGYHLSMDGDRAIANRAWVSDKNVLKGGYASRIVLPKQSVVLGRVSPIINNADASAPQTTDQNSFTSNAFGLMAGSTLFVHTGKDHNSTGWNWANRPASGTSLQFFRSYDLRDPTQLKPITQTNVLSLSENPQDPGIAPLIPHLWADDGFYNAKGGKPAHLLNADTVMFASGNRLYVRTVNHLYCIGKTGSPYNWKRQ